MLDALSALKYRLFSHTPRPQPRRPSAEPSLLSLRNLPDSDRLRPAPGPASTRPVVPDPLQPFAMSPEHGQLLVGLLQRHRKVLDPDYHMAEAPEQRAALNSFFTKRPQLLDAALATVPRATNDLRAWPDLAPVRTNADLLGQLLDSNQGLIVAEVHAGRASKQLLIDNMPHLRHLGVDTVYLEHLQADIHQADLNRYHRTGFLSPALQRFLSEQDSGHMTDADSGATFRNVVDAAFKVGMRVVALDLMTSYQVRGLHRIAEGNADELQIRINVMNHVAVERIRHDQLQQVGKPGPQRWVALVGNAHAGTFNTIPGIAERLGVPSLRVEDTSPTWSTRVQVGCDPGRTVPPSLRHSGGQMQCDYLLKVPAADGRARPETPAPCTAAEALRLREVRQAICALPEARSA